MVDKQTTKKVPLTVKNIRSNNKVNILTNIVKSTNKTRNDLALENQISIMTVKYIVDELIELGIVEEHTYEASIGRKPKALNVSNEYGNIICINLTSIDGISYLIYDIKERVLAKENIIFKDSKQSYQENLLQAIRSIQKNLSAVSTKTVGIAVSVPSAYYEEQDLVNYDLIADFKNLHIKKLFREKFNLNNILVLHDVFPAAKSEYESADPLTDSQFYFYCGAGVGGFFIHKGNPIMGDNLVAGEVGKMILSGDLNTKESLTFEKAVSVTSIKEKSNQIYQDIEFEEILERYERGDVKIQIILNEALNIIARVLYNIIWIYNPTKIVIDSCYKQFSFLIKQRLEAFLECFEYGSIPVKAQICQAQYDEYHMMRGCFKLVLEKWIEGIVQDPSSQSINAEEIG
ncbi:MAG: ROK family protein [Ruminiclostridium sp.]